MSINKSKLKKIILGVILVLIIFIISIFVVLIKNEEHYAKKRKYPVEKIIVKWINDGKHNYCQEGYETRIITDKSEVEKWRNMLYDVDTRGRWFSFKDSPPGWEVFFAVEVIYEDGYSELIQCTTSTRAYKYLGIKDSYALGSSKELYGWCYDLFFDEPHPYLPPK